MRSEGGFSLVEMLLSIVIISMLVGLSLPVYQSFQSRNNLDLTTQTVSEMLRRAQTYARGAKADGQWGVRIVAGSAVLYKGASYASRDPSQDETVIIPAPLTVGGLGEINFSKLAAIPNTTGNITLTDANINETRTVTLNGKGMVSY